MKKGDKIFYTISILIILFLIICVAINFGTGKNVFKLLSNKTATFCLKDSDCQWNMAELVMPDGSHSEPCSCFNKKFLKNAKEVGQEEWERSGREGIYLPSSAYCPNNPKKPCVCSFLKCKANK